MHRALALSLLLPALARAQAPEADLAPVLVPAPPPEPAPGEAERAPGAALTVIQPAPGEAKGTAELLRAAPGAVVRDYGGPGQLATVSLRGCGPEQVLVLLDGVPVTTASGGVVDLGALPAAFLDRLEVVRGSTGAEFGPGALGGTVNLVTRAPRAGPPALYGALTAGSYGTAELAASGTGSAGPGAALVGLRALATRGDYPYATPLTGEAAVRSNNDAKSLGGLARYALALDGGRQLELRLQADALERGLAGTAQNPDPAARLSEDRETLSLRYAQPLGPAQLEARPFLRRERTALGQGAAWGPDATDLLAGAEGRTRLRLGHHLVSGLVRAAGESLAGPAARSRPDLGLGLADEWLLASGRVSLLPAVRADYVEHFAGLSPGLAALYRPAEALELRASLGRSFRAPTFAELYVDQGLLAANPTLRPETGSSAELGARYGSERLSVAATGYAAVYEDLIIYEAAFGGRAKPYNVGTAGVAGAELELAFQPLPGLTASASYAYQRSRDLYDDERFYGHELPYHPHHTGFARLAWAGARTAAHAEALYQSAQTRNRLGNLGLAPRLELGLGGAVKPLADLPVWVGLEAKNLLDDRGEDLYGYPLPGRALYASLRFDTSPAPQELR